MTATVFFDAFAECVAGVGMARRYPLLLSHYRIVAMVHVANTHGPGYAAATGRMFDKLLHDMQNPEVKR